VTGSSVFTQLLGQVTGAKTGPVPTLVTNINLGNVISPFRVHLAGALHRLSSLLIPLSLACTCYTATQYIIIIIIITLRWWMYSAH